VWFLHVFFYNYVVIDDCHSLLHVKKWNHLLVLFNPWPSALSFYQGIWLVLSLAAFCNILKHAICFYSKALLAPRPTPMAGEHPSLLYIFAVRTRYVMHTRRQITFPPNWWICTARFMWGSNSRVIARNLNVLGVVLFLHRYNLTTVLMLGTRLYRRQRLREWTCVTGSHGWVSVGDGRNLDA
jgi:hypothetical protein